MYVLVRWWLVNHARPGEVAGTSLAYRTVSDQKVNSTQCSGEDSATTPRITRIRAQPPNFLSYPENKSTDFRIVAGKQQITDR